MTAHFGIRAAMGALALASIGATASAYAQGGQAPFTIRRPPDGSVVREKVRVEIPRSSIKPGGFVAMFIDDKFDIALAPETADYSGKPFTFVWDTKSGSVADGPHNIRAVLYNPAAGEGVSVTEAGDSSVNINVANKIKGGPSELKLRYHYREGENLNYALDSRAVIVGGVSETGSSDDQEISTASGKQQFAVEDAGSSVSLVRNRTTSLKVLTGGQEYTLAGGDMASSIYQEVDPLGLVHYEDGANAEVDQFAQQGIAISSTLQLPELPSETVVIGQTWSTRGQRLPLPGLALAGQPKVTLRNHLQGLEWENGYPTAHIHQTYEGAPKPVVDIGGVEVTGAQVKFERDIYLAYKSGTLVKTAQTFTISGRSTSVPGAPTAGGPPAGGFPGAPGGGFPGAAGGSAAMQQMMMGGMGGGKRGLAGGGNPMGMGGMMGGPPGMMGGGGMAGRYGGGMGGRFGQQGGGAMAGRYGGQGGMMPGGGAMGGFPGGPPGGSAAMQQMMMSGMGGGKRGLAGGNPMGMGGAMMGRFNPAGTGANAGADRAITVRSTTTTTLSGH